jgi:heavy metal-binding protein
MRSAVLVLLVALAAPAIAQKKELPPISYVCPMTGDEDVIEDKPGKCPKCGMTLVPIRLVSVWTCASKPGLVTEQKPGRCPADGTSLVQMTMAVSWTCPDSAKESTSPGTCADGSPMKANYKLRPHGNHNPQHGGQFFMAPDNWHHLEGTYPRAGVFRMYLYDDYTKPLARAQEKEIHGEIVVGGTSYPLALAPNGRYLEAKVAGAALPAAMQAKVKFKPDGQSNVFDFNFEKYSKDVAATAAAVMAKTAPAPAAPAAVPVTTPVAAPAMPTTPGVDPALIPLPIPDKVPEMLSQLRTRTDQIRTLIDKGLFADVYVPAFQAKDLALALEEHQNDLAAEKRRVTEPAIAKLVRSAYLLDAFGDLGNKQQISAAYDQFAAASKDILSAFPPPQP